MIQKALELTKLSVDNQSIMLILGFDRIIDG